MCVCVCMMIFVAGQFKGWLAWKEGNGHHILRLNNKSWQESSNSGPLSQSAERDPKGEGVLLQPLQP